MSLGCGRRWGHRDERRGSSASEVGTDDGIATTATATSTTTTITTTITTKPTNYKQATSSTLKDIDRAKSTAVNKKSPITPDILLRTKKGLKMSDRNDIVFWAACLVMFFGLFRKANLFQNKSLMRTSTSPGNPLCSMPTAR